MARITKAPDERRKEILNTAMKLFYEKGYEKTSISDIAKEMNVAQGLCYRYFPSKEVLFDSAIGYYAQTLVDKMAEFAKCKDLSLKDIIEKMPTFIDIENDNTIYYKFYHSSENSKIHARLSLSVCEKLMPIVCEILRNAAEKQDVIIEDIETAASFAVYGQLGILLDNSIPVDERIKKIKLFLLHMFSI